MSTFKIGEQPHECQAFVSNGTLVSICDKQCEECKYELGKPKR